MKILKGIFLVIGGIIGLLLLGGLGIFGYMKTAPSPADVCAHISAMSANPAVAQSDAGLRECEARLAPPSYGKLPYAQRMRCYAGAETREELAACDAR